MIRLVMVLALATVAGRAVAAQSPAQIVAGTATVTENVLHLRGLDTLKGTASDITVRVGETVRFGHLEITAETDDGLIMGLRHRALEVEGVQFHPESILTVGGHDMLATFLARAA